MPDNSPDQPGGTPPGGGSRRSGLDRLRAARGASEEPTSSGAATSVDAADPSDATAPDRAGVLLDKPRTEADTVEAPTEATPGPVGADTAAQDTAAEDTAAEGGAAADAADDTAGRGKGRGARKRAAAAGSAGAAGDTPDEPRKVASARGGRLGRARSTAGLTAGQNGPASQRQKVAALLLGLLIIGLLVPVVIMRHRIAGQSSEERAVSNLVEKRTIALTTARQFAITFFSPDYKTIDDYNKAVLAGSTGQFNQDFASKQGELKSLVTKAQSQATGHILTAGVSKVSGDDVEVLVVADQDVQNTLTKGKAQTLRTRVRITVHKTDKRWLVSGFEPVT
ncbi:MAG: Mce-associated rane protein [Frankiaceae bacterium]|nr:Mce-associated rane protein [Frankiaceae bacterium]